MISFIVPAQNEQARLGRTLQAIHESDVHAGCNQPRATLANATIGSACRSGVTKRRCQIMPSRRNKKWVIPSAFEGINP
jgi:hypothetical protein